MVHGNSWLERRSASSGHCLAGQRPTDRRRSDQRPTDRPPTDRPPTDRPPTDQPPTAQQQAAVRVIAGQAKGRRLVAASGVRPTGDRVREALFSSLGDLVEGAVVADLWAGTGALGLEARSRGAERVVLVERDRGALEAIRRNVDAVALDGVQVVARDVATYCHAPRTHTPDRVAFDLVLCDPPYATPDHQVWGALAALRSAQALPGGAVVVVERDRRAPSDPPPHWLALERTRTYGDTVVRFARVADDAEGLGSPAEHRRREGTSQ